MKAAIYARYSTDQQRETSIEDQRRNCERFAEREGWQLATLYADKGMSGTRADRPEYQRMLADAKARAFDVLLVDKLSRFARDSVENERALRRLEHWGIRIIGVTDGYDSVSKSRKVQRGVYGLMNEMYIDNLRDETIRGLTGQALKGNNCGGRAYGYRHVPIFDPRKTDQYGQRVITAVRREPDPAQAKWVRFIFEKYAEGYSPRTIASELNRLQVPSPGAAWKRVQRRKDAKWLGSTINAMLDNPLYIGQYIWNRSQWVKDPDTGKRQRRERPESEWVKTEEKKLRLVEQRVWDVVQARRHERAQLANNQHADIRPRHKYLFSGLLVCGVCGQKYTIADAYRYACGSHVNGGKHACANNLRVPRVLAEELLLDGIKNKLFAPAILEEYKRETARLLAEEKRRQRPDAEQARAALAKAEREIENIMVAIKAGILTPTTKTELEKAEAERTRLLAALNVDTRTLDKVAEFLPRAMDHYRALVAGLGTTAQRDVARARAQIKTLVRGRVTLHPTDQGYLEAEMAGDPAGLLKLVSNSANLNLHGSGGRI